MSQIERGLRRSIAFLAVVALALCAALPGWAKDPPGAEKVPSLPQPLTKESIRELVSRLSDDQVRRLLLDQLDRTAAAASTSPRSEMGMSGMVDEHAGAMRTTLGGLETAYYALPDTLRQVRTKLTESDGTEQLAVPLLLGILVAGFVIEGIYRRALHRFRAGLDRAPAATYSAQLFKYGVGLVIDLGAILVWTIAAISTFFLLWHEHELRRTVILDVIFAFIIVRTTMLVARFLLSPHDPSKRLLPFADEPARILYWFAVTIAIIYVIELALVTLLKGGGANAATLDLLGIPFPVLGAIVAVWTVWAVRTPIADMIRGHGEHAIRGWLAELWPILGTLYFLGVVFARIFDVLAGETVLSGQGIFSVLLLVAIPIVDMALCRALAAAAGTDVAEGHVARVRSLLADYEGVFRRAIHIVVVVAGLILYARVWGVDLFAFAQQGMGGKVSSAVLGVCIVLLLAYMIWEAAKTAIDRRLAAEGDLDPEAPASRLRTVLPLMRALIAITVFVMATLSVLAALGVDILPLIAGASVVGVAIGFGSQTLVRDIVSGAFFLMDDAFRLGEYLEIGDAKGRVEKINVRTLFLRHHRGAINILPYGEIKRIRNTNRDWMVMVMDFPLTYDTNLAQVKKILKQVGDEIAADPELKPDLLQPLKLAGIQSTEDSAIVVRAKFTARPEGEPYMIRKAAYTKILKAFREAGIKFAHKQVTVNVPALSHTNDEAMAAAAGAAALAAAT